MVAASGGRKSLAMKKESQGEVRSHQNRFWLGSLCDDVRMEKTRLRPAQRLTMGSATVVPATRGGAGVTARHVGAGPPSGALQNHHSGLMQVATLSLGLPAPRARTSPR